MKNEGGKTTRLYTMGCNKKSAQECFELIDDHEIRLVVDVRLNNTSQLTGFTNIRHLPFFLKKICVCRYRYEPELAPTLAMLKRYQTNAMTWSRYESRFLQILASRKIEDLFTEQEFMNTCLLCSESEPSRCHRRLVAEYIKKVTLKLKFSTYNSKGEA